MMHGTTNIKLREYEVAGWIHIGQDRKYVSS